MNILCTICMRAGSKGIKNKNLLKLNNKHLMEYTIEQALKSKQFRTIAVSTDSKKILNLSKQYGAHGWFLRPKSLSSSSAGKLPVIKHLLNKSEKKFDIKYDYIVDLDITAPLRKIIDIKKSLNLIIKNNKKNLITVTEPRRNPYFNMIEIEKGIPKKVKNTNLQIVRRQDAPKVYDLSASIFIWRRNCNFTYNELFTKHTQIFYLPPDRAIDIDSKLDLKFVEFLMKKNNEL